MSRSSGCWKVFCILFTGLAFILGGTVAAFATADLNAGVQAGQLVKKVDTFLVILDASGSKEDSVKGKTKLAYAKEVLSLMNKTIPNIQLTSALRTYGKARTRNSANKTELIYGLTQYTKSGFENALMGVRHGRGLSFMDAAIIAAEQDLKTASGRIAVIIVSDGKVEAKPALSAAQGLKDSYKDRICIYTIFIPSATKDIKVVARDRKLMADLAAISKCGFSVSATEIDSDKTMAEFVRKIFLGAVGDSDGDGVPDNMDQCPNTPAGVKVDAKGCPVDSDGDGVPDYLDQCPGTPKGVPVDEKGCPKDSDGDGVTDDKDQCPNTPKGTPVNAVGCPYAAQPAPAGPGDSDGDGITDDKDKCPNTPRGVRVNPIGCWVVSGLKFDSGKWDIKPQYYPGLDEVYEALKQNSGMTVEIQGHTDSVGSARYNQKLSEKRAKSVMEYLINKGIAPSRLSYKGYGFTRPAASNATPEGRQMNRRVEIFPIR